MPAHKIQRVQEASCGLLVIDLQEKFAPIIQNWDSVVALSTRLIRFFRLIKAPILVTEQYPEKLGPTVQPIHEVLSGSGAVVLPKTTFSSCGAPKFKQALKKSRRRQWILCGIETHVCIQQTTFEMLELGYEVFLAVDAMSSRRSKDREVALARLASAGAILSTSESLICETLRDTQHPLFKPAFALVKEIID